MTELDIIVDNEDNNNFHLEKNFHQLVMVNNQDIFDVKGEIALYFFANYNKGISINLAS